MESSAQCSLLGSRTCVSELSACYMLAQRLRCNHSVVCIGADISIGHSRGALTKRRANSTSFTPLVL